MVRISAQETMPGQALSSTVFMSLTTLKPLTELLFIVWGSLFLALYGVVVVHHSPHYKKHGIY
jgi:hypothetical protein